MNNMMNIMITWLIPFVCGSIVSGISAAFTLWRSGRKREEDENQLIKAGLQSLLRAELIRSCEKYETKGYCPVYARDSLERVYASYHELGGNGMITDLYNQIKELPTDTERKG